MGNLCFITPNFYVTRGTSYHQEGLSFATVGTFVSLQDVQFLLSSMKNVSYKSLLSKKITFFSWASVFLKFPKIEAETFFNFSYLFWNRLIRLYSTTIETQLALQTSKSTDITWTTHPDYIDNRFISKQRDDDSNYGDAVWHNSIHVNDYYKMEPTGTETTHNIPLHNYQ